MATAGRKKKKKLEWEHMGWAKFYGECIECGTTDKKHHAKGRCKSCYERWMYMIDGPKKREQRRKRARRFKQRHPERCRVGDKKYYEKIKADAGKYRKYLLNQKIRRLRRQGVDESILQSMV